MRSRGLQDQLYQNAVTSIRKDLTGMGEGVIFAFPSINPVLFRQVSTPVIHLV